MRKLIRRMFLELSQYKDDGNMDNLTIDELYEKTYYLNKLVSDKLRYAEYTLLEKYNPRTTEGELMNSGGEVKEMLTSLLKSVSHNLKICDQLDGYLDDSHREGNREYMLELWKDVRKGVYNSVNVLCVHEKLMGVLDKYEKDKHKDRFISSWINNNSGELKNYLR